MQEIIVVSNKGLLYKVIEEEISNQDLMSDAKISTNSITEIQNEQYIVLNKKESMIKALDYSPKDIT